MGFANAGRRRKLPVSAATVKERMWCQYFEGQMGSCDAERFPIFFRTGTVSYQEIMVIYRRIRHLGHTRDGDERITEDGNPAPNSGIEKFETWVVIVPESNSSSLGRTDKHY